MIVQKELTNNHLGMVICSHQLARVYSRLSHKVTFYKLILRRSENAFLKTMYVLTNSFWTVQYLL